LKKIFGIALVLALMTSLCFGSVALADDPVDVEVTWGGGLVDGGGFPVNSGSGWVSGTVTAGDDATTTFSTGGVEILGQFTANQTANTAYPYMGVDTFTTDLDAIVAGAGYGYIEYQTNRTDSYGSYGPPGQISYNYLEVADGYGAMAMRSTTNFASQRDYLWAQVKTPGGYNFEVDSSLYYLQRTVSASDGDFADLEAGGIGFAALEGISSGMGDDSLYFGRSWEPYDSYFTATGSGTFDLEGKGDNGVTFNNITMTGSTSGGMLWNGTLDLSGLPTVTATDAGSGAWLQIIANFTSNFDMGDYSVTAN